MKPLSAVERLFSRSEQYRSFIRRRAWLSWSTVLTCIGLVLAFSVVTRLMPFMANLPAFDQGAATIGIVSAVLIIVVIVLAAVYFVHWNNQEHARLSQIIVEDFLKEPQK